VASTRKRKTLRFETYFQNEFTTHTAHRSENAQTHNFKTQHAKRRTTREFLQNAAAWNPKRMEI
jgi:hypothetical protein